MDFKIALQEFEELLTEIKTARSPQTYPAEPTVNSLFLNASNLIHAYQSLLGRDFSKQLTNAKKAKGNGHYKLSHLEPFVTDVIKQLKRNVRLKGMDKDTARSEAKERIESKTVDVVRLLSDESYVNSKLQLLRETIDKSPHVAIGTSKELIETCCKGILDYFEVVPEPDWSLLKLVKETNKILHFGPEIHDEKFRKSVQLVTNGLANVVHGIADIRNRFGSGHGHSPGFKELDKAYTHLVVFSAIEWITFYLRIFNSQKSKSSSKR